MKGGLDMTEYFIGMHCKFDDIKYKRDYTSIISGIEFCNFEEQKQIQRMLDIAKEDNFKIGIHFPLNKTSYKYRDPLLLSLNEDDVSEAFKAVEKEVKYASEIGAEYILIHFPKPMIVDESLSWEKCRFSNKNEIIEEKEYPFEEFKKNCNFAFNKLSKLSMKYKIQIVLEIEMLNKYFYQGKLLKELLEQYPNLKLCLDSARIHVLSNIDNNFDYKEFIKRFAKYTYLLHISNIKVTDIIEDGHHPALKNLKTEEGWGDIGEFLSIISSENKDVKVLFEHRSDILTDDELNQCYEWVMSYF